MRTYLPKRNRQREGCSSRWNQRGFVRWSCLLLQTTHSKSLLNSRVLSKYYIITCKRKWYPFFSIKRRGKKAQKEITYYMEYIWLRWIILFASQFIQIFLSWQVCVKFTSQFWFKIDWISKIIHWCDPKSTCRARINLSTTYESISKINISIMIDMR